MFPNFSRVAVLWCGHSSPVATRQWTETQAAGHDLGVQVSSLEVGTPPDLDAVFAAATRQRVEAVVLFDCSRLTVHGKRIVELATKHRLPVMYPFPYFPRLGGLISYGPNPLEGYRRAAVYVDKILKGADPATLPVEQPTTFDLVVNLKAARALGITIPRSLLLRASVVIE